MLSIAFVTLLLAGADPAPAAQTAAQPEAVVPAAKPKKKASDLVCWDETPTGSHFAERVCMTKDQLERNRHDSEELMQRRSNPQTPKFPG